ncbi:MAG: hypothetical protein QF886_01750 [Planctomycetota bacterium]|jgi:hypothetical protein|nr:hypothetical protein [Planctomycetota bacterium]
MKLIDTSLSEVTHLRERQGKSSNAIRFADELEPEMKLPKSMLMSLGYLERLLLKMQHEFGEQSGGSKVLEILSWTEG